MNGYYDPVRIGELLNQRYQVVHKLGRGGFSTVWLAFDRERGVHVALKIVNLALGSAAKEYDTHSKIVKKVQDSSRLVMCQEHFLVRRMNRATKHEYDVLVLPLRGPNILTLQRDLKQPLPSHMAVAKQLLQAVASLHKANLVHRGWQHCSFA